MLQMSLNKHLNLQASKRKFITWDGWNGGEKTRTGTVIAALTVN